MRKHKIGKLYLLTTLSLLALTTKSFINSFSNLRQRQVDELRKHRKERIFNLRMKTFRRVCDSGKAGVTGEEVAGAAASGEELPLIYVQEYNLSYCMVGNSGSTSILYNLKSFLPPLEGADAKGIRMQAKFMSE